MASKNSQKVVWIQSQVVHEFVNAANQFDPLETGGVLMGYWGDDTSVVITQSVGPGPNAIHKVNSFIPDHKYQVGEIERIYTDSGYTETYLGDWHVHPGSAAYLSSTDKKTLKRIAAYKPARLQFPIMIVLGTTPSQLKAWVHCYTCFSIVSRIEECNIRVFD